MIPFTFTKKKHGGYHYHHHEIMDDNDTYGLIALLLAIWGLYWLIVHWVDYLLGDWLIWWVEPLTIFVVLPVVVGVVMVVEEYGWNPLYWWPMFWGTKIYLDRDTDFYMEFDEQEFMQNNGGRINVHCGNWRDEEMYVKFRRKRDAVIYSLKNL
jgi:hypothetical protein